MFLLPCNACISAAYAIMWCPVRLSGICHVHGLCRNEYMYPHSKRILKLFHHWIARGHRMHVGYENIAIFDQHLALSQK